MELRLDNKEMWQNRIETFETWSWLSWREDGSSESVLNELNTERELVDKVAFKSNLLVSVACIARLDSAED